MKRFILNRFIMLIPIVFFSFGGYSQEVVPDETFGHGGMVTTAINVIGKCELRATALQSDGKIVAAGIFHNEDGNDDFAIVRFYSDGNLDPTFGSNGIITKNLFKYEGLSALAIQSDGKILIGGFTTTQIVKVFYLARFNQDGNIDSTFGTYGQVLHLFSSQVSEINSLSLQNDGKIIVAGTDGLGSNVKFAAVRYNTDGKIDTTFGNDGQVTTINPFTDEPFPVQNIIQKNGKIILGDYRSLIRYNIDGSVDSTFGDEAKVKLPVTFWAYTMTTDPDENIILGGYSFSDSDPDEYHFDILRYNLNGIYDSTFGINGITRTVIGDGSYINKIHVQSDGKLVATGNANIGTTITFPVIARYKNNGEPDTGFGTNGILTEQTKGWCATSLIKGDGKIIIAGDESNGNNRFFYLTTYNADGTIDNTFGKTGTAYGGIGNTSSFIRSIAIQNDGKIVAVGISNQGDGSDLTIARYDTEGKLDPLFGSDGILISPLDSNGTESVTGMLIQNDGKIVVSASGPAGKLVRFNSNGFFDKDFGANGTVSVNFYPYTMVAQPDGKFIVAGGTGTDYYTNLKLIIARVNANGSYDNSFGTNGIQYIEFENLSALPFASALQEDGKIIIAGWARKGTEFIGIGIARCNPDGSPDSTFGFDGKVDTVIGKSSYINSIAIQNGKIVMAGRVNGIPVIGRYNSDGSFDSTFGENGLVYFPEMNNSDGFKTVKIQGDNKIVTLLNVNDGFKIVRYTENGELDHSFGSDGTFFADRPGLSTNFIAHSIAIQDNGYITTGGNLGSNNYSAFYLTRYKSAVVSEVKENISYHNNNSVILDQNYPNPFNNFTSIRYSVPEYGHVTIKLYDITGKEIKTLVSKYHNPGVYDYELFADGLDSGIYLYKISVENQSVTRRMLIVK